MDSNWSEEDWDREEEEIREAEKGRRGQTKQQQEEERIPDYDPLNLKYDPSYKEDILPLFDTQILTPEAQKEKKPEEEEKDLDPNYYP